MTTLFVSDVHLESCRPEIGDQFVALDDPSVLAAAQAGYLGGTELVLGMTVNGESRAYPLQMTWYHHVINDQLGGKPITVTY